MTPKLATQYIHIHRARENNLKNVEVDIPLFQLTVVTGVSGSGKSSLVMDVLHGEAQRKFAESMTSYARQFLVNTKKPDVDYISRLCPSIAIHQHQFSGGHRSTVGTVTEIYDYLRLLYARLGKIISPKTGKEVKCYQANDIAEEVVQLLGDKKIFVTFSVKPERSEKKQKEQIEVLLRKGFTRVYLPESKKIIDIEGEVEQNLISKQDQLKVLVDRLTVQADKETQQRLVDSIQTTLFEGNQALEIFTEQGKAYRYTTRLEDEDFVYLPPTPSLFSFNNSYGICPTCEGYGTVLDVDPKLVIPDMNKSVYEGAVAPWKGDKMSNYRAYFMSQSAVYNFPIHRPIKKLTEKELHLLWHGDGKQVEGIYDFFEEVKRNLYKIQYRVLLSRYQGKTTCRSCNGYRLRKEALYVQWKGKNIGEATTMPLEELNAWLDEQSFSDTEKKIADRLMTEIRQRVQTLMQLGLSYLSLDRPVATLSGGESQRVQLAKFIGSNLTDSLYVLDEPSIGLHQKDTDNLIKVLQQLRNLGNTVVVVEHDESIIRSADHIVDMGPLAGRYGGEVVIAGSPAEIEKSDSLTSQYLHKRLTISREKKKNFDSYVELEGASLFNLQDANIRIPTGSFTVVHGPSGSGKSSLINKILYPAVCKALGVPTEIKGAGSHDAFRLPSYFRAVEWVSQESVSRMSRSNPISYIQAYDTLRKILANLEQSKRLFLTASSFSFNSPGGRCEECKGEGKKVIEMQFLPPVQLECEACKGKRFTEEVLSVKLNGMNIYDMLNMTVDEAVPFFAKHTTLQKKLQALEKVGLGYVQLGQSTSTLSGGELQRLKLASFLTSQRHEPTLFFFDEPTVGLHFHDVKKLMVIFDELLHEGHSLVVIEHNMDVIACADWWIELGPESGKKGGKIMYCGEAITLSEPVIPPKKAKNKS